MFELDHIALVCTDLDTGAAWLSHRLGVSLLDGGKHARFGTHNKVLALADGLYLEVIAPDPAVEINVPRWFDLDNAPLVPRWGNWICRADGLTSEIAGPAISMSRGDLRWQITVPKDGGLPMLGGYPTLIKWANMAMHPTATLPASGCKLLTWEIHHPQATKLRELCEMADPRVRFVAAEIVGFVGKFQTPNGEVTI